MYVCMYLCCWLITLCCHCTALFPLQSRNLGPGTYRLDLGVFDSKSVSERAKGPGWKRAYDSVQLATIPHMLYKEQWEQKRLLEEKRGPGVYDTKDLVDVLSSRPSSKLGVCSTRVPRFRIESQVCSVRVCVRVYCTCTEVALDFALVVVFPSQLVEIHHTHYPSLDASCTSGIQLGIYMCICLALHNMRTYPTSFWMCVCVCTAVSRHHSRPWVLWQGRRPLVPIGGKVSEVPRHRGDAGQWRGGPQETAHHCKWEGQGMHGEDSV